MLRLMYRQGEIIRSQELTIEFMRRQIEAIRDEANSQHRETLVDRHKISNISTDLHTQKDDIKSINRFHHRVIGAVSLAAFALGLVAWAWKDKISDISILADQYALQRCEASGRCVRIPTAPEGSAPRALAASPTPTPAAAPAQKGAQ
jgi:hypothetical protein